MYIDYEEIEAIERGEEKKEVRARGLENMEVDPAEHYEEAEEVLSHLNLNFQY